LRARSELNKKEAKAQGEEGRLSPDRSLPIGEPLLVFFRYSVFRPIVVVGICLEHNPGGLCKKSRTTGFRPRNLAAQLHKWLMAIGFVAKLRWFQFYSVGCPQPAGASRLAASEPPGDGGFVRPIRPLNID